MPVPPASLTPNKLPLASITIALVGPAALLEPGNIVSEVNIQLVPDGFSSKAAPPLRELPEAVLPKRLPAASKVKLVNGSSPSEKPLKIWRTVCFHGPRSVGVSLNTVPQPCELAVQEPPTRGVPYKLPAPSRITPPEGSEPRVPLNSSKVENFQVVPGDKRKTVPQPLNPAQKEVLWLPPSSAVP